MGSLQPQASKRNRRRRPEEGVASEECVAYLGPVGTFSHLVALRRFHSYARMVAQPDIPSIFEFLLDHPTALAVVPIENSSGGAIYDTVDLLIAHARSIQIWEDLSLDVRLALLGHPGIPIQRIYSHFVPLRHHRDWLAANFPKARIIPVNSTAMAAKKASSSPNAAALASPEAASLYGLNILQFPIRPETVNVTRFFVVGQQRGDQARFTKRWKTSATFQLKNTCGSLHAFLGAFARHSVNLRMIISRPLPGRPESYVFVMEVDGSINEQPVKKAFEKASTWCDELNLLGSYPSRSRYTAAIKS